MSPSGILDSKGHHGDNWGTLNGGSGLHGCKVSVLCPDPDSFMVIILLDSLVFRDILLCSSMVGIAGKWFQMLLVLNLWLFYNNNNNNNNNHTHTHTHKELQVRPMQKFNTALSQGGVGALGHPGVNPSSTMCLVDLPPWAGYFISLCFSFSSIKGQEHPSTSPNSCCEDSVGDPQSAHSAGTITTSAHVG